MKNEFMHEESRKVRRVGMEWNTKATGKTIHKYKAIKAFEVGEQTFHDMTQYSGAFIRVTSEKSCDMSSRLPSQLYHSQKKEKKRKRISSKLHQNAIVTHHLSGLLLRAKSTFLNINK